MKTMQPFDDVVEAHGTTVLRVCASVLGPGPDAEDAWSETFLAALRAHPLADNVNVEAWLVRVAQRRSIDIVRSRQREAVTDAELLADGVDRSVFITEHAEEHADDIWDEVAGLSEQQQFVVAHRFIAQWTYPEIAEKLGCSPAAARRSGADAIAALRRRRFANEEN